MFCSSFNATERNAGATTKTQAQKTRKIVLQTITKIIRMQAQYTIPGPSGLHKYKAIALQHTLQRVAFWLADQLKEPKDPRGEWTRIRLLKIDYRMPNRNRPPLKKFHWSLTQLINGNPVSFMEEHVAVLLPHWSVRMERVLQDNMWEEHTYLIIHAPLGKSQKKEKGGGGAGDSGDSGDSGEEEEVEGGEVEGEEAE